MSAQAPSPVDATPAARLIKQFGVATLAGWTRRDRSRVHAWTWPKDRGGTGGLVPHAVRSSIIEGAAAKGEVLTYADFEPQAGEAYLPDHVRAREDVQ